MEQDQMDRPYRAPIVPDGLNAVRIEILGSQEYRLSD